MRNCLSLLLAILLSLNATYAASMGVCTTLEHTQSFSVHFGHHEHSGDHVHDEPAVDTDGTNNIPAVGDHHHHAHVHPVFFSLPTTSVGVILLKGRSSLMAYPASIFVSAPQARLDRPPKAALA